MDELDGLIRRLPKADLHLHLDGAVRPETLWDLARERDAPLPPGGLDGLRRALTWRLGFTIADCLACFELVTGLLQDAPALRRVAREVVEDAAAEGCSRVEVRYAPQLSIRGGLSLAEAVDATLAGLAEAQGKTGAVAGLILCCTRGMDARAALELADLAVAYAGRGVVGLDIADTASERPAHDLAPFVEAYTRAGRAGLGRTCHAGEVGGPESIRAAVELLGVDRIGHGVAAGSDPALIELLRRRGIPVEVCLSSNLFTGTVTDLAAHPFGLFYRAGIPVVLCTDDPAMENTTLCREYRMATQAFQLSPEDLQELAAVSLRAAFACNA